MSVRFVARLLARGLYAVARQGQLRQSPQGVSLALVDWYRSTSGRRRCPTGLDGTRASCSRYGRRVIQRYGVWLGWWLAVARMRQCAALHCRDYGPQGCCEQDGGRGLCR